MARLLVHRVLHPAHVRFRGCNNSVEVSTTFTGALRVHHSWSHTTVWIVRLCRRAHIDVDGLTHVLLAAQSCRQTPCRRFSAGRCPPMLAAVIFMADHSTLRSATSGGN